MTDKERRIMRVLVRLAVAIETIHTAAFDAGAVRGDLSKVLEKAERSLRWAANRFQDELERDGGGRGA